MAKILLEIEGRDEGATRALKEAELGAQRLEIAIGKLAQRDFAAREAEGARVAYEKMTEGQKQAALASANYADKMAKAAEESEKAAAAAAKMEEANQKNQMGWTDLKSQIDLAIGGLQAFGQAAQEVYEFGKAGAVVIQTADSFDGLIEKVGASSDLLQQLRDASAGTVDDMTLMSSTVTLVAGAEDELAASLTNATPQLLEIAKAANKLNPELGDTAFLYESIATGVKRASPQILDNLGLTIRVGEANEKYAAQLGKSANELTAVEQKQALLNATLEAGNVLIEQAGGAAGSATDNFNRFEAALSNTADIAKAKAAPAISAVAGALADVLEQGQKNAAFDAATQGMTDIEKGAYLAQAALLGMTDAEERARDAAQRNSQVVEQQAPIIEQDADSTWDLQNALAISADAQARFESNTAATNARLEAQQQLSDELVSAQERLAQVEGNWTEKEGGDVQRMLEGKRLSAEQYALGLSAIDQAAGTSFATENELAIKQQELVDKFASGQITAEEFAVGIENLNSMFLPLNESVQEATELVQILQEEANRLSERTYSVIFRGVKTGWWPDGSGGTPGNPGGSGENGESDNSNPATPRAVGGEVFAGRNYWVGESGPEPLIPSVNGRILSVQDAKDALAGGGGGVTIMPGAIVIQGGMADAGQIADMVIQRINQQFKSARFGGGYAGVG